MQETPMPPLSAFTRFLFALLVFPLALLGGCGSSDNGSTSTGTLSLALTDAPACGLESVFVTIDRIQVHQNAEAEPTDSGWSEIVLAPAMRVDLLTLQNGVLAELGQTPLPAGHYSQMRLVLVDNDTPPYANSVIPDGGSEVALTTPSGQQTGLKLNIDIQIEPNQVADFVLDFDACKSVVKRGNSGEYNLKPVIRVIPVIGDAGQRIVGYVEPGLPETTVSAQSAGEVVKATQPDSNGMFVLYPVTAGTYDVVVTASGHVTSRIHGVPVSTTAYTYVGSADAPITPAASEANDAQFSLDADASVRALQSIGGQAVEIAGATHVAGAGYVFTLPIAAPVHAAYVAAPDVLSFSEDPDQAGLYRLEANDGTRTLADDINLSTADSSTDFTFAP